MTALADNILAGINGGGTAGNALAHFGAIGTAAPTATDSALNAAFKDAGWCSENGLAGKFSVSSTDIPAFGTFQPVRTIITQAKQTFDIEFLESNPISLAVYHQLALSALVPDMDGAFDFTTGAASTQKYAAVFDLVDGVNAVRAYAPSVQVTDKGDFTVKAGAVVSYPVTLTAFPDDTGASVYWFYLVDALATP